VVFQIGHDRLFAAVQRGVANAIHALIGLDLQRDEVAPGQVTITRAVVIFIGVSPNWAGVFKALTNSSWSVNLERGKAI
jgi:hypothetical protein